jgi:hypothetical protein
MRWHEALSRLTLYLDARYCRSKAIELYDFGASSMRLVNKKITGA